MAHARRKSFRACDGAIFTFSVVAMLLVTGTWAFSARRGSEFTVSSRLAYHHHHRRRSYFQPSWAAVVSTKTTRPPKTCRYGCFIEVVEPETQCQVVLVGCFHGSQSSAADVEASLSSNPQAARTDVVVLELCASRFADLRKDFMLSQQQKQQLQQQENEDQEAEVDVGITNKQQSLSPPTQPKQKQLPWIQRYSRMIQKTAQAQGLPTAVAAAILGGVSGLQTALSNLEPGLEFTTATQIAAANNMDIVLADQAVDTTLQKMGQLPWIALEMWQDCFVLGWNDTFGREWSALTTALCGTSSGPSVTLWAFLTRSDAARRDLLRLTLAPLLLLQLVNVALTQGIGHLLLLTPVGDADLLSTAAATTAAATSNTASSLLTSSGGGVVGDADFITSVAVALAHASVCVLGCLTVALPATRVVLRERDDQLAEGIRAACRHTSSSTSNKRVVAVLGLLHVNGVAQRLRTTRTTTTTPTNAIETTINESSFSNGST